MRSYLLALSILLSFNVFAATPKTVTLDVKNMTCELCPVTVKKALEKTPGVAKAQIDFAKKTATVAALTQSTTNAGYSSTEREVK
jgi:periplasmic mercuric ion binding protein